MTTPDKTITAAKNAETNRKAILTKIHRVIDAYEDGQTSRSCIDTIRQILGRSGNAK